MTAMSSAATAVPLRRPRAAPRWARWLPLGAAAAGGLLSLPQRMSFLLFLRSDQGATLAATVLANAGRQPNLDFGYPFGPLSLAPQQAFLKLAGNGPWAMTALTLLATLAFGAGAAWAIDALALDLAPALLLSAATLVAAITCLWSPVYGLEAAGLLWTVTLLAAGRRAPALAVCAATALTKPSMAVVVGAILTAEGIWRILRQPRGGRARAVARWLALPLAWTTALGGALLLWYGPAGFWRLALPLRGAANYKAVHFSFFSRADNPFFIPGMRLGYYLGSPLLAWSGAELALLAALGLTWRRVRAEDDDGARWAAAAACGLGTLAFVCGFYSWQVSYANYATLPLIGCALWGARADSRRLRAGLAALAGLAVLGTFSVGRDDVARWRHQRRSPVTAGLWATPAEAGAWKRFAAAHPPGTHPLLLIASGSPEAIFPAYGPPWHAYLYYGEATRREMAALRRRAAKAGCAAVFTIPDTPEGAVVPELGPAGTPNVLFTPYGCGPGGRAGGSAAARPPLRRESARHPG
jgi:hypothetical protein